MSHSLIPRYTERTQTYPELAKALKLLLDRRGMTVADLQRHMIDCRRELGLSKVPGQGAIGALINGGMSFRSTAEVLVVYLREHAPDAIIGEVTDCTLDAFDFEGFLGASLRKIRQLGPALAGTYRAYALAESVPDAIRIGEIRIDYDAGRGKITIFERQERKDIVRDGRRIFPARKQSWEGVVAPRKEKPIALLRMSQLGAVDFDCKLMVFDVMHQMAGTHRIGEIEIHSFNAYNETNRQRPERYYAVRHDDDDPIECSVDPISTAPPELVARVTWPLDRLLHIDRSFASPLAQV